MTNKGKRGYCEFVIKNIRNRYSNFVKDKIKTKLSQGLIGIFNPACQKIEKSQFPYSRSIELDCQPQTATPMTTKKIIAINPNHTFHQYAHRKDLKAGNFRLTTEILITFQVLSMFESLLTEVNWLSEKETNLCG